MNEAVAAVEVPLRGGQVDRAIIGWRRDCCQKPVPHSAFEVACLIMLHGYGLPLVTVSFLVLVAVVACIAASNQVQPLALNDDTPQAAARRFLFSHSQNSAQQAWLAKKRTSLVDSPYNSITRNQLVDRSQFSSAHMTNILSSGGDASVTDETSNVGSAMRIALDASLKHDIKDKYTLEKSKMSRVLALLKKIPLTLPHDVLADPNIGVATIPAVRPIL
jgi:hypothetical protein